MLSLDIATETSEGFPQQQCCVPLLSLLITHYRLGLSAFLQSRSSLVGFSYDHFIVIVINFHDRDALCKPEQGCEGISLVMICNPLQGFAKELGSKMVDFWHKYLGQAPLHRRSENSSTLRLLGKCGGVFAQSKRISQKLAILSLDYGVHTETEV